MDRGSAEVGSRLAGIDGLRALAASSILIHHVWLYGQPSGERVDLGLLGRFVLPYLPAGVGLFFTLSGFLLYRPVAAAVLRRSSSPDLRRYLTNRALRIFPAYWAILVVVGILLPAALVRPSPAKLELGRLVGDSSLLLQNFLLIQHYFPRSVLTGIQPTWSLAVELIFYLILPALGWVAAACGTRAATPRGRTLSALVPVALLGAVGFSHKLVLLFSPLGSGSRTGWSGDWFSVAVRSFWGQADLFLFGYGAGGDLGERGRCAFGAPRLVA